MTTSSGVIANLDGVTIKGKGVDSRHDAACLAVHRDFANVLRKTGFLSGKPFGQVRGVILYCDHVESIKRPFRFKFQRFGNGVVGLELEFFVSNRRVGKLEHKVYGKLVVSIMLDLLIEYSIKNDYDPSLLLPFAERRRPQPAEDVFESVRSKLKHLRDA